MGPVFGWIQRHLGLDVGEETPAFLGALSIAITSLDARPRAVPRAILGQATYTWEDAIGRR